VQRFISYPDNKENEKQKTLATTLKTILSSMPRTVRTDANW